MFQSRLWSSRSATVGTFLHPSRRSTSNVLASLNDHNDDRRRGRVRRKMLPLVPQHRSLCPGSGSANAALRHDLGAQLDGVDRAVGVWLDVVGPGNP